MKTRHFKYIPFLLVCLLLGACEMDNNMQAIGNWTMTEPQLKPGVDQIELDESQPDVSFTFEWEPAVTSNRFIVNYRFLLMEVGEEDLSKALMEVVPGNSGRALSVSPKASDINYALWAACYPSGETVGLEWVVVAKAIEREVVARRAISITPYATEHQPQTLFISGSATENGEGPAQALAMKQMVKADGTNTGIFELYTSLKENATFHFRDKAAVGSRQFGGDTGSLVACGEEISVPEAGIYRVRVDLNANSYELTAIDRWSLVGDAVEGGWGGDVPLEYVGGGKWQADIAFFKPYEAAGYIFRANGDWGLLLKRVVGTGSSNGLEGQLVMESEASALGLEFEDLPGPAAGTYTVTLDLSAAGPTFFLEPKDVTTPPVQTDAVIGKTANPNADAVSGNFSFGEYEAPEQLFLVADGQAVVSFAKDGSVFHSEVFKALEASRTYVLSDQADGSGNIYGHSEGLIAVETDQAYQLSVDFGSGTLFWKYYNLKVFHWDDPNGGWDSRDEVLMTYVHPYQFEVTAALKAGFDIKINSPWDVEFGTDDTALTGTMVNKGPNFKGITQSGNYLIKVTVAEDFSECTYEFVKQ